MHANTPATGAVRVLRDGPVAAPCAATRGAGGDPGPTEGEWATADRPDAHTRVRVTIDADDRNSRRVVESLEQLRSERLEVEVRDAREDPHAADALTRLVCCGPVTPVVEVGGLLLTAPTPAEALLAVRRVTPGLG